MPSSARRKNRKAKFGENPATRLQAEYQPLIDLFQPPTVAYITDL
jgi:hypothetical protein